MHLILTSRADPPLPLARLRTRHLSKIRAADLRFTPDEAACQFTTVMRHFLPLARKTPVNYALVLTPILAPPVVLALAWDQMASPLFSLILVGWLAFLSGPFLTSMLRAEPLYDVILGWPVQSPPADWQVFRERYFRLNLIRLTGSGLAFLLFLVAFSLPLI